MHVILLVILGYLLYLVLAPKSYRGHLCKCWRCHPLIVHIYHWEDEVTELWDAVLTYLSDPTDQHAWDILDEFSDVCETVGRLQSAMIVLIFRIFNVELELVYIRFPGDCLYIRKSVLRYNRYGCIRSMRHLVNGHCPSDL